MRHDIWTTQVRVEVHCSPGFESNDFLDIFLTGPFDFSAASLANSSWTPVATRLGCSGSPAPAVQILTALAKVRLAR